MTNDSMTMRRYDLEGRTSKFGQLVIVFSQKIYENQVTKPLISQLIRSATSIGANYCEADDAESRKDFKHKIGICKKEARETKHWLNMIATAVPPLSNEAQTLLNEAKELNLIFNAIINSTNRNDS